MAGGSAPQQEETACIDEGGSQALGEIKGRRRRGRTTEDEMVGWHHQLNGHEFEQSPGDDEGHGSPACCDPQGPKESDTTYQLNTQALECLKILNYLILNHSGLRVGPVFNGKCHKRKKMG